LVAVVVSLEDRQSASAVFRIESVHLMERYRIGVDGAVYFITMSVVDWLPVFVSGAACKVLTDSLNCCHERNGLRVNAYVIMPTHFHGIVFGREFNPESLKAALTDLRKFTGRTLTDYCAHHMPPCYDEVFARAAGEDRHHRFWQPTLHPETIQTEEFWTQKLDYLHDNPCRKGLVARAEYWRFSSASHWRADGPTANDVFLSAIDW
jgi:REP element-mobilizing transposase RayT